VAASSSLRFTVEVAADQATGALQALTTAFNQAGIKSRTSLLGMGGASRQASNEVMTLGDRMRAFAREQRQEAGAARFFVNELAQVAPVSDQARTALMGVTSALVGGLGVGTAIGLVTTGATLLVNHLRESAREAEEFAASSAKAIDDLDKRIEALRGKSGAERAQDEYRLLAMQAESRRELIALSEDQIRIERESGADLNPEIIRQAQERIEKAKEELHQLDRRAEKLQEIAKLEVQGADAKAAEQAAEARRKRREQERAEEAKHLAEQKALKDRTWREEFEAEQAAEAAYVSQKAERQKAAEAVEAELLREKARRLAEIENQEFLAAYEERLRREQEFRNLGVSALQSFARSAVGELGKAMRASGAYARAMREATGANVEGADLSAAAFAKMAQDVLATLAEQASVEALMEVARGIRDAAMGLPTASGHFASAAAFGAAAAAAGVAATIIGSHRGMTASERASVDAASSAAAGGGAGGAGGSGGGYDPAQTRETTTRETIFVIGPPGMTESEMARITARSLAVARRLDMLGSAS
jgi:hypothetical protein